MTLLVLGEREIAEGKVTVKDMISVEQKIVEAWVFLNCVK